MPNDITVISFGFGHPEGAPIANVLLDIRKRYYDPHIDPAMRQMTGRDQAVQDRVMATPGAAFLLDSLEPSAASAADTAPSYSLPGWLTCSAGPRFTATSTRR